MTRTITILVSDVTTDPCTRWFYLPNMHPASQDFAGDTQDVEMDQSLRSLRPSGKKQWYMINPSYRHATF
jgi:hypothetical protein